MQHGAVSVQSCLLHSVLPFHPEPGGSQLVVKQTDGLFHKTDQVDCLPLRFQHAAGNLGQLEKGVNQIPHITGLLIQT